MPHYKDGSPAHVGDFVIGKPYNTPREVVGELLSITPGVEVCNCQVAFLETIENFSEFIAKQPSPIVFAKGARNNGDGTLTTIGLIPRIDYGETRAFQLVSRVVEPETAPPAVAA